MLLLEVIDFAFLAGGAVLCGRLAGDFGGGGDIGLGLCLARLGEGLLGCIGTPVGELLLRLDLADLGRRSGVTRRLDGCQEKRQRERDQDCDEDRRAGQPEEFGEASEHGLGSLPGAQAALNLW
jgi:hypothetical protein